MSLAMDYSQHHELHEIHCKTNELDLLDQEDKDSQNKRKIIKLSVIECLPIKRQNFYFLRKFSIYSMGWEEMDNFKR